MDYIVLEGADGTGKTTLAKKLAEKMDAWFTYEPYGETTCTESLRNFALNKHFREEVNTEAREYLMLANRAISTDLVQKKLDEGKKVVSDRSAISGMVYAQVASNYDFDDWWAIAYRAFKVLPEVVVLVTTPEQNIKVAENDIYDTAGSDFHTQIKETFPHVCNWFLEGHHIPYIFFENSFERTPDENAELLLKRIQDFEKLI